MKKTVVLASVLLLMAAISFSQSLSPTLLASQGGFDRSDSMVLEWTLGESAVETIAEENTIYSQGFIQPLLETSHEIVQILGEILIFPNPVNTHLNVKLLLDSNTQVTTDIYNVNGRLVRQFTNGFSLAKTIQLDVADLPTGIYFVRISSPKGLLKSHKIIKD